MHKIAPEKRTLRRPHGGTQKREASRQERYKETRDIEQVLDEKTGGGRGEGRTTQEPAQVPSGGSRGMIKLASTAQ